jgi:hypothetical protein
MNQPDNNLEQNNEVQSNNDFLKSSRFNQLEKILTCPKCNQIFCDPVTLFCQHTLCQSCLVIESPDKCFVCNNDIMLPTNGNYQLKNIIDKIYGEDYFKHRKEDFQQILSNDLKLKKKYEIYKTYFPLLINKIKDSHGKFTLQSVNSYSYPSF